MKATREQAEAYASKNNLRVTRFHAGYWYFISNDPNASKLDECRSHSTIINILKFMEMCHV